MKAKLWYVDSWAGWFVVHCTKREARSVGVAEFGRGGVKEVRPATVEELTYFVSLKGKRSLEP